MVNSGRYRFPLSRYIQMHFRRLPGVVACGFLVVFQVKGAPPGNLLLEALRDGDDARAGKLLAAGAPVNALDEYGASALMYAALYSDAAMVGRLLERGANPNHADASGATALMWAIPDEGKVRQLVKHGAKVNVSSKLGRTPLLIAAGRPNGAAVVRFLLDRGADPKARDGKGVTTLIRAVYSGDLDIFRLLVDRGVDVNARGDFQLTALMEAVIQGNRPMAEMLLGYGADIRLRDQDGFTALTSAGSFADTAFFRFLIDQGAEPSVRSNTGIDLLMAAAASDTTTPEMIRELRSRKVDPQIRAANFHTKHGYGVSERPLDWASRHGDTPVLRILTEWTGVEPPSAPVDSGPRLQAKTARVAVEKGLGLLYAADSESFKRGGCVSCHHNVLPALAYSIARDQGMVVDPEAVKRNERQLLAVIKPLEANFYQDMMMAQGHRSVPPTHCEQEASRREIDSFRLAKGQLFGPRFDRWEQRRISRGSEERQ